MKRRSLVLGALAVVLAAGSAAGASRAEALIYWVNNPNTIGRADLDGSKPDPDFITGTAAGQFMVRKGKNLYWANNGSSSIGKARIDGTDVNQTFVATGIFPTHIGLGGGFLYWDNNGPPATMGRAAVDGSSVNNGYLSGFTNAPAVTADDDAFYFAWWPTNTIFRRAHDTNDSTPLHTPGDEPYSLSVDSDYVYWADFGAGTFGRMGKDGADPEPNFITGVDGPAQIVSSGKYVYWTANFGKSIGRALRKDGSNVRHTFIDLAGADSPYGIAVDDIPSTGNRFRIKKKPLKAKGKARLTLALDGPGRVKITGKGIKNINRKTGKFRLKLQLKPIKGVARKLAARGAATTGIKIRFKPDLSDTPRTKKTKVRFVKRP